MDCLLEQPSKICLFLKSSGQNVFQEEIFFCGKRIYFPTFSTHYSLLFKHSVFLCCFFFGFFWWGGVRHSMLIKMLNFLGPFKRYVRSVGGGERGYSKNVRKRTRGGGSSMSIRKPIFI